MIIEKIVCLKFLQKELYCEEINIYHYISFVSLFFIFFLIYNIFTRLPKVQKLCVCL
jgi:hypothetical protein